MDDNNIPNFDAMNEDELRAFWGIWHRASRAKAVTLVGVRKDAVKAVQTLANYAINKSVAVGCRLKGEIDSALCYEHACDLCYERLPVDLRW